MGFDGDPLGGVFILFPIDLLLLQSHMLSKQNFERLNSDGLAALCKSVVYKPGVETAVAEEAWQLRREWVRLVGSQQPLDYKLNEGIQAEEKALAVRMANFLTATL
ncbi:MAG: hypothetical protein ABSF15_12800 [Candidatus Sulfotelmatobacter sp.]|jgi:hypothetical protein